jgi:hypothetical protein
MFAGVPVIAPVDALIDKPVGNAGEIVYVYEGVPFMPATGINEVAATLLASVVVGIAWKAESKSVVKLIVETAVVLPVGSLTIM